MNDKLVSIVLPVYNGASFLRQSIDSCLKQTYGNIELIVVDDASTDDSVAIVSSYNDVRVKLVRHSSNRKLPAALNTGFAQTAGAYLTWTSHDNYYVSTAVAEMVNFLQGNPAVDIVFTDQYCIGEDGQLESLRHTGPVEHLTHYNSVGACFLYRRKVYEELGDYNERAFLAEDYDYWLRALAHFTFAHLERPLYYYRSHAQSLTALYSRKEVIQMGLAIRRRILGRHLWKNRSMLHWIHISAATQLYQANKRPAAVCAALWGMLFKPESLFQYNSIALLASLVLGPTVSGLLRRAKRGMNARLPEQS